MKKQERTTAGRQEADGKLHHVWVGESDRIASFHAIEGYRRETFSCHDLFIQYLRQLQERGFRFQ